MEYSKTPAKVVLCVLLALVLASCVTSPQSSTTGDTRPLQPAYSFWPHDVSDLKPDAGIKYGVLTNGMRYAIMHNSQPAGAVSLKFRIASGSLHETDQQRGMAHFLEHMAFNGSKNVPEGEFVKLLQRKGLAFGAHTNAYTSTDETVYMLELPKNDPDLVDTGLMLFREIGDRLLLDPQAIARERGVVLSEQRTRNTPEYRAYEARWQVWYEGQRQADRLPIGTTQSIQGANQEQVTEYYHRNYRPERTFLVVVGDIDPVALEKLIKTKFGDWKGEGTPSPEPDIGLPKQRGLVAKSFVEPNLPEDVSVSWFQPPDYDADNFGNRAHQANWGMAITILNRRLERLARGVNAPFISASVGRSESRGVSNSLNISIDCKPGSWRTAMAAANQEVRRALEFGFSNAEVARELKEWRAGLEDSAGSASTRPTSALAGQLVAEFAGRGVFTHPKDDLAIFERYAPTLTAATAQAGLSEIVVGQGPIVFVSSGQPVTGGETSIAATFTASQSTKLAALTEQAAKVFPYTDFGKAGEVAERKVVADFGISTLKFQNGVRVNFKRTDYEKDTVNVTVRFGGGFLKLPMNKVGMYWALPFSFTEGGLNRLTTDEMEESLAGRIVSVDLGLDDDAFEFSGRTNQRDFLLQLQLLAAYATDPAYRSLGLERLQTSAETDIKQYSSSPGRVIARETSALLRSGDARWAFPTLQQLQSIKMSDISSVLQPSFQGAPIEISVVGDLDEAEVTKAIAQTFGAFGTRPLKLEESAESRNVRFPLTKKSLRFVHEGVEDQAAAFVAWPAPDFYSNMRRARTLTLLREMLKVRLTDEFREVQGATYSPSASSSYSSVFANFGYVSASAETRPDLVEGFYTTLEKVVQELKSGSFTEDLINRARTPILKSLEKSRQTNGYWAGAITDLQTEPRGLEALRSQLSDVQSITKQELIDVAVKYLTSTRRIDLRVLSKKAKSTAIYPEKYNHWYVSPLKQQPRRELAVAAR